ncbi:MAG: STAS domain-containing protein [Verrucomicrobiales bacterium]|jgi:anti-anti-sigma factor|nr:STAS domain-containing protein [Verrucomicrobiales bacterium]
MELSFAEIGDDVSLLKLAGNLDLTGTRAVEVEVLAGCGGERPLVLIGLSETRFVSSLGVRLLLQALKTVAGRGGRLLFLNPSAPVASVLEISGLSAHAFRGSESDAVGALQHSFLGQVPA